MRYALYFVTAEDHPLTALADRWLGRAGALPQVAGFDAGERAALVKSAGRYGFHATMKAPFRLANKRSEADLFEVFDTWCAATPGAGLVKLEITQIQGFFALTPAAPSALLQALADETVRHFEPYRAPLTHAEIEKRNPSRLTPKQLRHLEQYGYPYVFDEFFFHMTLTDRVGPEQSPVVRSALEDWFAAAIAAPVHIDRMAIFVEPREGDPFHIAVERPLAPPNPNGNA